MASSKPKAEDQEYFEDDLPSFAPMPWSLKQIREAIPPRLFVREAVKGLSFLGRDLALAALAWSFATYIDPFFTHSEVKIVLTSAGADVLRWSAWII
ncbi:hypothetical protein DXG03_008855 [Asterophora parasitica]|uniref:Uncharacterized protein n=1 Tax=Asterophora parasitica TaxID=117018 RepID=A0A9P7G503_9AGAR|nr:hypothetical protein DXG03_008855 [Asterophora parasitica]